MPARVRSLISPDLNALLTSLETILKFQAVCSLHLKVYPMHGGLQDRFVTFFLRYNLENKTIGPIYIG